MKKGILIPIMITLAACTAQAAKNSGQIEMTAQKPTIAMAPPKVLPKNQVTVVNTSSSYILEVEMPLPSTVKRSDLTHGYTVFLKPGELKYGLQLPHKETMYVTATNKYTDAKSNATPVKRHFESDLVFEINASGKTPKVQVTSLNEEQAIAKGYQK